MAVQAQIGPHSSAVQFELDGIVHGLMANPDRKFVYCEMVRPPARRLPRWPTCALPSRNAPQGCPQFGPSPSSRAPQPAPAWPLPGSITRLPLTARVPFVQSFFKRWWDMQEPQTQERVKELVRSGQLDFAGGGWVSNDEAICTYDDIIDQLTIGHRCGRLR